MTLIESYDTSPLQNIAECLAIEPDRLILVGSRSQLDAGAQHYQSILKSHQLKTVLIPKAIESESLDDIRREFEQLIRQNSPCAIDLFGGNELHLVAAGAAFYALKDSFDVSLQKLDMQRGVILRIDGDKLTALDKHPKLTVAQSVEIYGGSVCFDGTKTVEKYDSKDINALWDIARKDPAVWNKKLHALNFFEGRNGCHNEDLDVCVDIYCDCGGMANPEESRDFFREIIAQLKDRRVITVQEDRYGEYRYRYKNSLVRSCLKKEGNVLEYKTFFAVRECTKEGRPLFDDCALGVMLDWNGDAEGSTRNEIDIMAMHGAVPVFISCKNGVIDDEELYKLNSVALKLGGEFAKKVLIATDFEPPAERTKQAVLQRAKDMGIAFEPDAAQFTEEDWNAFFQKILK